MTSRPAVGSQQPPQRIAGRPRAAIRARSAQVNTTASNARRPGLIVDLTGGDTGPPRSGDGRSVSGGSGPATPVLEVSNRLGNGTRGEKYREGSAGASSPGIERVPAIFPPRPGRFVPEQATSALDRPGALPNWPKDETKAHSYDPPVAAQLYPQGKTTDFNPWNGNHVEDSLTEQTVKAGYSVKALVTNETNTARPSLWSHLKSPKGIQNLSQLFVTILEKRQASLSLTAPSTFKPPPRVTLTNTKREAWLRDLANSAFALRRLNRTIPYGINGKVLLEQCLNKDIPTARAVWLAKCIGANELRTLKRKGVTGVPGISGELKWVREWTVHVEQFVETTIVNTSEESWKEKMQYVIRLVYHLFAEQLLDHEHYLDWILSSFESSAMERIPMWLVHIQLYWKHMVINRKRGKRLAECLLNHLETASLHKDVDLLMPVLNKIRTLVATLAQSHKGCLILPQSCKQTREQLQALSDRPEFASVQTAIATVITRNERLAPAQGRRSRSLALSSRRKVFQILDGVSLDISIDKITSQCLDVFGEVHDLIPILLQWASSIYREGSHRLYVVARILRRCRALGADIESAVLAFVTGLSETSGVEVENISRIVAELVRSKQFAVGHMLQSIIATGWISSAGKTSPITQRVVNLLRDIPESGLPQHVSDLKQIILQSAGLQKLDGGEDIESIKQIISRSLFTSSNVGLSLDSSILDRLQARCLSEKIALAVWLRQDVLSLLQNDKGPPQLSEMPTHPLGYSFTSQVFFVARDVLESIGDIAILADIIGICLGSSSMETMASLINTLHFHYRSFAAIGALQPLLKQLVERYQSLRYDSSLEKSYLQALADLCSTVGVDEGVQQQLNYDISRCDQRNNLTMCSPASDNAADMLTSNSMDLDDDIERILSSGTTMDEQSMARMFKRLTSRLEEQSPPKSSRCGQWLNHLRSFDDSTFDGLIRDWLSSSTFTSNPTHYRHVLPTLVGSECLTLTTFVQIVDDCAQMLGADDHSANIILELGMLEAILPVVPCNSTATIPETYKYELEKRKFAFQFPTIILQRMQRLILLASNNAGSPYERAISALLSSPSSLAVLRHVAINTKQSLFENVETSSDASAQGLKAVLDKLLDPSDSLKLSTLSQRDQLTRLGDVADDLSLPFCQLEIQFILKTGTAPSRQDLALSLFESVIHAGDDHRLMWLELICSLESGILFQIRRHAESKVLTAITDNIQAFQNQGRLPDTAHVQEDQKLLRRCMNIVESTSATSLDDVSDCGHAVNDSLRAIADTLGSLDNSSSTLDKYMSSLSATGICHNIDALLQLLISHRHLTATTKTNTGEQTSVIRTLCSLLVHPQLCKLRSTCEFIFDVATYFSDELSDETRAHFLKMDPYNDPRISFLFGPTTVTDGWLGLVTLNNALQPPGSISGPDTSQARFAPGQQQPGSARMQQQRAPNPQRQAGSSMQNSQKSFNPPVPFRLRRWELLPDQGNNASGNDTAISLSLFGARKVDSQL